MFHYTSRQEYMVVEGRSMTYWLKNITHPIAIYIHYSKGYFSYRLLFQNRIMDYKESLHSCI